MFAGYSRKGDRTYARLVTSRRVDGKVVKETSNLGRVVDRRRNVFRSRERGTSAFDPGTGEFGPAPAGGWPVPPEGLVLDFGDAWALDSLATSEGLWSAPGAASPADPDGSGAHCARQRIEQAFDVGKNYASLLPLRVHPEETPGGHLLPAFRATALLCRPRPGMPAKATPMPQALAAARNQKREACGSKAVTCEPTSSANEPCGAIGAVCPVEIPLPCGKK